MKKKIIIIAGEPNSINSEIIAKSWKKINKNLKKRIIIIGNYELIKCQFKILQISIQLNKIEKINDLTSEKKLNILDIPLKFKNPFKIIDKDIRKYLFLCFEYAHKISKQKKTAGFINCAINKKILFKNNNSGVTEYLAKMNSLKQHYVMMIYNKLLSVVPITTHIKLKNVHKRLNKTIIINKIKTLNNYYYKLFKKKPRIAVLGVNPHNSEFRKNSEEQRIIVPTIIKLKKLDIKVSGPYSADTVFVEKKRNNFDVIIGMYHDQVLTPFKTLFEFDAINITLGLDYIRLSPDHGTAVDIIKKNKANTTSLMNSIKFIEKL